MNPPQSAGAQGCGHFAGSAARPGTVSARTRLAPYRNHNQLSEMNRENLPSLPSLSYHETRAEEESALAQTATTPGAVRAHVALADLHLEILYRNQGTADVPDGG